MFRAAMPCTGVGTLFARVHIEAFTVTKIPIEIAFVPCVVLPLNHSFSLHFVFHKLTLRLIA